MVKSFPHENLSTAISVNVNHIINVRNCERPKLSYVDQLLLIHCYVFIRTRTYESTV